MSINIGIWDHDSNRAMEVRNNLEVAMRALKLNGAITVNCEPPQLSRQPLAVYPSLEIKGMFWSRIPGETISADHITNLLVKLKAENGLE